MHNVVAFALFGGHPTYGTRQYYWDCLPGCLRSYKNFYPDWEFRVYHDASVDEERSKLLRGYAEAGLLTLIPAGENKAVCRSMLWRIKPIWDEQVNAVICRDMDGAACLKERRSVDQWLESGKACHTINDNPAHSEPMMGGMVGFRPQQVRPLLGYNTWEDFVNQSSELHQPTGGWDQILMRMVMWGKLRTNTCSHRFAGMHLEDGVQVIQSVDEAWPDNMNPRLKGHTEGLVPFIGCSGVDVPQAKEIYDTYGDPVLAQRIQQAEQ